MLFAGCDAGSESETLLGFEKSVRAVFPPSLSLYQSLSLHQSLSLSLLWALVDFVKGMNGIASRNQANHPISPSH
jgi:hypothetical protein